MNRLSAVLRVILAGFFVGFLACALVPSAFSATLEEGLGAQKRGDYQTAMTLFRSLAEQGNAEAQFRAGWLHYYGLTGQSTTFLDQYVESNPDVAKRLGHGSVIEKNDAEAVRWFRMAAEQGHAGSQFFLGLIYEDGKGVQQDHMEAAKWFRRAADQEFDSAQFKLGFMYDLGRGVAQDHVQAGVWYRKAAEKGNPFAQTGLGRLYDFGRGVRQDHAEAARWYRKAAEQGDDFAQFNLGYLYENGQGVTRDHVEAARWYRRSADQGSFMAQSALGRLYARGLGVPLDRVQAHKWFNLASANGSAADRDAASKARDAIAARMTPAQIAEAQRLARQWKPEPSAVPPETKDGSVGAPEKTSALAIKAPAKPQGGPPEVFIRPISTTSDQTVEVTGKVTGKGRITGFQIDGTEVAIGRDGAFSVRRGIPLGESEIKVVATDEWGRSSEARIGVNRTVASTETAYPPLRSNLIRGKARPDALALIIGVERYKSVPQADFAEGDAKAFYDFAVNSLGIPPSRVKLLIGPDAQKVDVDAAVLTWLKPLVEAGKTDVFVFFSGHGLASDDGRDLYLLPHDGNRALLDRSAIRRSELIDMVVSGGPRTATFFIDACYSGGTRGAETLVASARPVLLTAKEQPVPSNVTILTAAANDQLSSALGQAKHGLFSYFLMRGLSGEAAGGDRTITAGELAVYLTERVPPEAAKLGRSQTPQIIGDAGKIITSW